MTPKKTAYINDCGNCRLTDVCNHKPMQKKYCKYHVHVMMPEDADTMLKQLKKDGYVK